MRQTRGDRDIRPERRRRIGEMRYQDRCDPHEGSVPRRALQNRRPLPGHPALDPVDKREDGPADPE
jgi:hypothetical protein